MNATDGVLETYHVMKEITSKPRFTFNTVG